MIIPGINIQWPWSELILSGKKSVETRTYPLPEKYLGKKLAVIETAGKSGLKLAGIEKARITGIVVFSESFQYLSYDNWKSDFKRHLVKDDDPQFAFSDVKPKWGWVVSNHIRFNQFVEAPSKRGIVFASECHIPIVSKRMDHRSNDAML